MPITQERENIQDLRAVGFTENQALVLAAKLEAAAHATSQDFKSFFIAEMDKRFGDVEKRFGDVDKRFSEQEARFERTLRAHLATLATIIVGVAGIVLAILKFFPAGH
jgi:hypothetical protein